MPVRDVGMDPYSKIRSKNNSISSQSQVQSASINISMNKEGAGTAKKFINISKR